MQITHNGDIYSLEHTDYGNAGEYRFTVYGANGNSFTYSINDYGTPNEKMRALAATMRAMAAHLEPLAENIF